MHLSTLHRASLGRLDRGALPMLGRASLGRLLDTDEPPVDVPPRKIGGDDAPAVGRSGRSRKWIRREFKEHEDEIKAAVRALQALSEKPTVAKAKKAAKAIAKIDNSVPDPVVRATLTGATIAGDQIEQLLKVQSQFLFMLEQIEAFKKREKRQEDAMVALLLI